MKTPDELKLDTDRILNGKSTNSQSVNSVDGIPVGLISYVSSNIDFCSKQDWYKQNLKYFSKDPDKYFW